MEDFSFERQVENRQIDDFLMCTVKGLQSRDEN